LIINAHTPTEDKEGEEKDQFYYLLNRTYNKTPSNDIKMVIGDLNAKIGKQGIYHGTIPEQSLHTDPNGNGQRITDFTTGRNMVISSTYFSLKAYTKEHGDRPMAGHAIK
jgi:hypothetical protein